MIDDNYYFKVNEKKYKISDLKKMKLKKLGKIIEEIEKERKTELNINYSHSLNKFLRIIRHILSENHIKNRIIYNKLSKKEIETK